MKKLLLLSAFAFASILTANAQHQITQLDAPAVGSVDAQEQDTVPSVVPGPSGANQTWDLTSIQSMISATTTYIDPKTTNDTIDFPTANVALSVGNQTFYYNSSATAFTQVGGIFSIPSGPDIILKGKPTKKVLQFTSAYQASFHDSSVFKGSAYYGQMYQGQQIDSVRVTNKTISDTQYDAYGTVITPVNTFRNTLRENKHSINTTKVEGYVLVGGAFHIWAAFINTKTNTNSYSWYADGNRFPVANIVETIDSTGNKKVTSSQYNNTAMVGIGSIVRNNAKISVYPNPAVNELNVTIANASVISIDVFNVIGEKMETVILTGATNTAKINTSAYNTGLYMYKLNDKNGAVIASGKFNVSK